jgi:hypothetical protein
MNELADLLREMNSHLSDISMQLTEISAKLETSHIDAVSNLEQALDRVADNITGETGYSLTDIHSKLEDIHTQLVTNS